MARFVYLNVNADNETVSDCVTRAIKLATGLSYSKVRKKLYHTAKLMNCDKLCPACYRHLLEDVFKFKTVFCKGYTIGEFADTHPFGTYIVRVPSHLTTVIDGEIYDIWDCRKEWCDIVWKVE